MTELHDSAFANESLDDGQTTQLEVDCKPDDVSHVVLFVDGGSTGTAAAQYDVRIDKWDHRPTPSDWRRYGSETNSTAFSIVDPAKGPKMRYTIENTSGNAGETYRATLESYQEGE